MVTARDEGSFSRGKDAKTEMTWKNKKKVEEVKEGWNGNGRGLEVKEGVTPEEASRVATPQ